MSAPEKPKVCSQLHMMSTMPKIAHLSALKFRNSVVELECHGEPENHNLNDHVQLLSKYMVMMWGKKLGRIS